MSWLLNLLTGGFFTSVTSTINSITAAISNEKIAALNAKTDQERIAAEERASQLQSQRDVLIADASQSKLDLYVRSLIALGPTSYLIKIFLYDKVIGSFVGCGVKDAPGYCAHYNTDPLDPNLWTVVSVVLGFYFIATASISISKILKT
jgi:hypothetical protein